jgi:amino acid transporter
MGFTPEETHGTAHTPNSAPAATGQQGLVKVLHGFGNFAIAMSTICILAGGITSFYVGFCSVGGASIGLGWPLVGLFALTVALTMAEAASAFPRAGGPYQWAAELGGNGWGWVAGCFNLAGLVTALAAVNMGLCLFVISAMNRWLDFQPQDLSPWIAAIGAALITVTQAAVSHWGMRLTSWLTNVSGVLIVVVAVALTACMVAFPLAQGRTPDFSRLVTFANYSGPAGDGIFPLADNLVWLFLLGLLLPAYTITGFDASAQTAEETFGAERIVPRAIVRAVLLSGAAGWVMLSAVVLAAPNLDEAAAKGTESFFWIVRSVIEPQVVRTTLYVGIDIAQYVCGLATLTAASRLAWALARDDGLPFSRFLRRVGSHHTPALAVWSVCGVAVFFLLFVPYTAVAAVSATFLYIAYVIPTAWGLLTYGRWPTTGPWRLGRWYRPLAVLCVAGCVVLIVISIQPPNAVAAPIVGATVVALVGLWFGWMRHHFRRAAPSDSRTAAPVESPGG